jgi:hypothetical protein
MLAYQDRVIYGCILELEALKVLYNMPYLAKVFSSHTSSSNSNLLRARNSSFSHERECLILNLDPSSLLAGQMPMSSQNLILLYNLNTRGHIHINV